MAELLRDEDSTDRHLGQARRHMRRCNKTAGAASLVQSIQPAYAGLEAAQAAAVQAARAEEDALDDLELAGRDGADALRNLSAAAKEHDRKNPADNTHDTLLPDGFSDFIHNDGTVEPITLDRLGAKVKALGDAHALAVRAGELAAAAAAIRTSEAAAKTATEARALADANEEIAQAALRRAFEANYLDGRKLFGRERVERLFPRARRKKKDAGTPPAPPVTPS